MSEGNKAQLRAERRAQQASQKAVRAAKKEQRIENVASRIPAGATAATQQRSKKPSQSEERQQRSNSRPPSEAPVAQDAVQKITNVTGSVPSSTAQPNLHATIRSEEQIPIQTTKSAAEVHPAFSLLAIKFANGSIAGSDACCLAAVEAFKQLVIDYEVSKDKSFCRELENAIKPSVSRIANNRSLPPAIASLVKQLKLHLNSMSNDISNSDVKADRQNVIDWLEDFADRHIILSAQAIAEAVTTKLKTMTHSKAPIVIMIYSFSSTVEKVLMEAHQKNIDFEVAVVDSLTKRHGLSTVRKLASAGIKCQYVLINAAPLLLDRVDVVLLGADGLLANGNVVAPLGSTQVAMLANAKNLPVLVVCATYKFCEKVFTGTSETDWPDTEVTPAEFVTGVVTELRTLPCSAVPAVLRLKQLGGGIC